MGSNAKKTRFLVTFDEQPRQLFSVRQTTDKTLLVATKFEEVHFDNVGDPAKAVVEERYSVHPSAASPGTSLKRTLVYADRTEKTAVQFIKDSKNDLLAVLYSKFCPVLTDRYVPNVRAKDDIVQVGAFSRFDVTALIYHVIVGDPGKQFPEINGYSLTVTSFTRFNIALYSTYINLPGSHNSAMIAPYTLKPPADAPNQKYAYGVDRLVMTATGGAI